MRMRRPAVSIALCLAVVGAHAQTSPESNAGCNSPDLPQMDMNACAFQAFKKQDRELNALYGRLTKQSDPESLKQLQAAQRAWLQFRDLECVYETPYAGGSIAPTEKADCMADLTKERIMDLKRSLRDQMK